MKENNRSLRKFVENWNLEKYDEKIIFYIIEAFSEYVVAVDTEYKYNKSFLPEFSKKFILSLQQMYIKKDILQREILAPLKKYQKDIVVTIDDTWIFENGNVMLAEHFRNDVINSNKIQYQIKYVGEPQFVITKEVAISDAEIYIKEDITRFVDRVIKIKNDL